MRRPARPRGGQGDADYAAAEQPHLEGRWEARAAAKRPVTAPPERSRSSPCAEAASRSFGPRGCNASVFDPKAGCCRKRLSSRHTMHIEHVNQTLQLANGHALMHAQRLQTKVSLARAARFGTSQCGQLGWRQNEGRQNHPVVTPTTLSRVRFCALLNMPRGYHTLLVSPYASVATEVSRSQKGKITVGRRALMAPVGW